MVTYHQQAPVAFIWGQFQQRYRNYQSTKISLKISYLRFHLNFTGANEFISNRWLIISISQYDTDSGYTWIISSYLSCKYICPWLYIFTLNLLYIHNIPDTWRTNISVHLMMQLCKNDYMYFVKFDVHMYMIWCLNFNCFQCFHLLTRKLQALTIFVQPITVLAFKTTAHISDSRLKSNDHGQRYSVSVCIHKLNAWSATRYRQTNCLENTRIFIQRNEFENIFSMMTAILAVC